MEYKENHKKCSLAFKKEAAMKAVANKQKLKKKNRILKHENGQNQPAKLDIKY